MSPIKINVGGAKKRSTSKPASKPAAKRTTRSQAKPAAKKASTAKKSTAKRSTAKSNGGPGSRGPRTPKVEPKLLAKHVKALEDAGQRRAEAEAEHDEAVTNVHEVATAALAAEVPMTLISEKLGISRQWLYKMGNFRSRTNGKKKPAKKATSASRTTRSTKKSTTATKAKAKATSATKKQRVRIGRK